MRISVIGAGEVGLSLARGLAGAGHSVVLGSRDPSKPAAIELMRLFPGSVRVTGYRDAVEAGELVVLAVPGRLVVDVAEEIGAPLFTGKTVIDPTNPAVVDGDAVSSAFGTDDSAAEALQRALPDASVVKAFSQIEAALMTSPGPEERRPLRIAGDDEDARKLVADLAASFGWKVRDLGPLTRSRALERSFIEWLAGRKREDASS